MHTSSIEDMIRTRIADGKFDDVQRVDSKTRRSAMDDATGDDAPLLSQEKSSTGLGEVVAVQYIQYCSSTVAVLYSSAQCRIYTNKGLSACAFVVLLREAILVVDRRV